MKRLWICVAFLAIYGNLAFADDSDEQDFSYYDDSNYEYNYDPKHYSGEETKENNVNKQHLFTDSNFRTTKMYNQFENQDYLVEDNRSELNEDNFNSAAKDSNIEPEKNIGKQHEIEHLSNAEVDNLGIVLNKLGYEKEHSVENEERTAFKKKIFEDTTAILNDERGNDFSENDNVDLNTEKTSSLTKMLEETKRLLKEMMEDENKNGDEKFPNYFNLPSDYDEGLSKEKHETSKEDSVDQDIKDLEILHDSNNNTVEWNYEDKISVNNITFSEESEEIDEVDKDKDKEEHAESILKALPGDSQLNQVTNTAHPILYQDDALQASESKITSLEGDKNVGVPKFITQEIILEDVINNIQPVNRNLLISKPKSSSTVELTETTPSIDDSSNLEFVNPMKSFASQKIITNITQNDINFANIVWLSVDNPTVITSPGFPGPYPRNSVTDWMISGNGMGIELNVTEFAVNGHVGDYLLIKPGGVDESGSTGFLFSYALHKERRYRFLDVDKMFVRFEAKPGPQFLGGFSFSVRMVVPRPGPPEPEPEPEQGIPEPTATITLNLGGVSVERFTQIEEAFRQIVAQMAATYIANNDIDPGVNTTLETTQIRSRAMCFHNWPKFEQCVEVRFGVPLVFNDDQIEEREPRLNAEDLTNMWNTYSIRYPYAESLRSLGITEYQVPNDRGILTVWLVIAGGVVISMTMLAFALWRFSCFENYTRMPSFSDTDSIKEKRNMDLYPTPHQTLPPLYSDMDYKWADAQYDDTKVDVRGYSNKSYMREDPYDLDSDEDVVPVSARNTSFSPRDIYSV